jgi:hypothetical protein
MKGLYDITIPSELPTVNIGELLDDPLSRALASLRDPRSVRHQAFAEVVAQELRDEFVLERNDKENLVIQWFDFEKSRIWVRAGGARKLWQKTSKVLRSVARPVDPDGQFAHGPDLYENKFFLTPVVDMLKNLLPTGVDMPDLDGDVCRFKLMFSDGQLLDLMTGFTRQGLPADRFSKTVGYPFPVWESDTKQRAVEVVNAIHKSWAEAPGGAGCPLSDQLKTNLEELQSPVLKFFYGLFEDWDSAIWLLRQSVKSIGAVPRLEEFLWMSNSKGSNGKGTWIALMKAVLGRQGFYHQMDFAEFVGTRNKGNSPELAMAEGKRFIAVNEAPEGEMKSQLNVTLLKKIACPDEDLAVTAKYKDPSAFTPMALCSFFTNGTPNFPVHDGGLQSRLSYLFMPFVFTPNPKPDSNERQLKMDVKDNVKALVPELLFWAVQFTPNILMFQGRTLRPRPEKVDADTSSHYLQADVVDDNMQTSLGTLICTWTPSMGLPSRRMDIDKAVQLATGKNSREHLQGILFESNPALKTRNYFTQRANGKSVAVYKAYMVDGALWDGIGEQPALAVVTLK